MEINRKRTPLCDKVFSNQTNTNKGKVFSMINSIRYFEDECIKKFEKLEDDFMREPLKMAEYVISLTEELHNLGLRMIQESLESMDQIIQKSPIRLKHWVVESHETKQLITSLGTVTFNKTLFTNKETNTSEYLLDRILGLERNERITEDAEAKMLKEGDSVSIKGSCSGGKYSSILDTESITFKRCAINKK